MSKLVAERELHDARAAGGLDVAEVPVRQARLRAAEIHLVEGVEELGAELHSAAALRDPDGLDDRQVRRRVRGTAENVASGVAVASRLVRRESSGIEELLDHVVPARVGAYRIS